MPGFAVPAGEPPPAPSPLSDSAVKKRAANPDWLLHAMEAKPKVRDGQQRRADQTDDHPAGIESHEETEPDLMLKIYREQEVKDREQQRSPGSEPDSTLSKPGDVGLFSDLLKQWISPRDLTLFGLESASSSAAGGGFVPPSAPLLPPPPEIAVTPRGPNPFLDAIQLDCVRRT